jgi:hypothetical protein
MEDFDSPRSFDSTTLNTPSSVYSYDDSSDLIVSIELRRNDTGKTVGVYQERLCDRNSLTLNSIKVLWDYYESNLPSIFASQIIPELPQVKLHYFVYWTRYNVRDPVGFYFKCMAWHERNTIPDPFYNRKRQAYLLSFVFFLVEDLADSIPHDDHEPIEFIR